MPLDWVCEYWLYLVGCRCSFCVVFDIVCGRR